MAQTQNWRTGTEVRASGALSGGGPAVTAGTFALGAGQPSGVPVRGVLVVRVVQVKRFDRAGVGHVPVGELVDHAVEGAVVRQLKTAKQQTRSQLCDVGVETST